jgi:hypothetical protein
MLLCGDGAGSMLLLFLLIWLRHRLRLSSVRFAALFAVTVRSNYSDAGTIAAKFSTGKINWILIATLSGQLRTFTDLRSPHQFFATPATVTAPLRKRTLARRTSQLTQQFSAMLAFQRNAPRFVPDSWEGYFP